MSNDSGEFRDVFDLLQQKIPGLQAVVLVGPEEVLDYLLIDPAVSVDMVSAEYATLLRIATRTSEDAGAGNVIEQIMVSEKSIMMARSVPPNDFLILLFQGQELIGRTRYELRQASLEIQRRSLAKKA